MTKSYEDAIAQLAELLNLSDEAIQVAMGFETASESVRRHVRLILNDDMAARFPVLKALYDEARGADQERFNRMIEEAQRRARRQGDSDDA